MTAIAWTTPLRGRKIPYLKQRYRMTKEDIVGACREVIAKKKK
jgi:hypothetical protein